MDDFELLWRIEGIRYVVEAWRSDTAFKLVVRSLAGKLLASEVEELRTVFDAWQELIEAIMNDNADNETLPPLTDAVRAALDRLMR